MDEAEKKQLVEWVNQLPPDRVPQEERERFTKIVEKTVLLNTSGSAPQPPKWGEWSTLTDEDLAFLNHLQKRLAVRNHLEESFPGKTVRHYVDGPSGDDSFRVEGDGLSLRVNDEFLGGDALTAEEIRQELTRLPLVDQMRAAGKTNRVILTRSGNEKPSLHVEALVRPRVIPPNQGR